MKMEEKELYIMRFKERERKYAYDLFSYCARYLHSTILNALEYIQTHLDHTVVFRRSCYHGSCGTCGILVNGKPKLACLTRVAALPEKKIYLDPLAAFPQIKDLATDIATLYRKLPQDATYLRNTETEDVPLGQASIPHSKKRLENCIECGLCESACPIKKNFIGPAALSAHHREIINRPERESEMLDAVSKADGVAGCKSHYECSKACPASVYPAGDIIKIKAALDVRAKR